MDEFVVLESAVEQTDASGVLMQELDQDHAARLQRLNQPVTIGGECPTGGARKTGDETKSGFRYADLAASELWPARFWSYCPLVNVVRTLSCCTCGTTECGLCREAECT